MYVLQQSIVIENQASLHENFYETLAHKQILLAHCIVYEAVLLARQKIW